MKIEYVITFLVLGFVFGWFLKSPEENSVIETKTVDTLYQKITLKDTVTEIRYKTRKETVNIDSLYEIAKAEASKLFGKDTLATLKNVLFESVTDTLIADSLSEIYVKASYYSRLPLDPKRSMEIEIEKKVFIPTVYYEKQIPFYKERCFIPLVGMGVITAILIIK